MRNVWRDIADITILESDNIVNKLMTNYSCCYPLLDLQADSRPHVRNGDAPLWPSRYLYLKHVVRNVSRFHLRAHTLALESSIWRGANGHCDKCACAAVQNEVHALLHCQDLLVCSERSARSYLSLFLRRLLMFCMPCLVRLSLISFLNGTTNSTISSRA